jgi:hypothetical protein
VKGESRDLIGGGDPDDARPMIGGERLRGFLQPELGSSRPRWI